MKTHNQTLQAANPAVRAGPYRPPARPAHIDLLLDGNEGIPPALDLAAVLGKSGPELLRRYPDTSVLQQLLATRHGQPADCVLPTAGADDAIDRCLRVYAGPDNPIILADPTFEMIPRYGELSGAPLRPVPWRRGPFPRQGFIDAAGDQAGVLAVVTPNNPTGGVATADDLRALAAACPKCLLLVDLAYGDFADEDLTAAALELPNSVVLRSFSKAGGLAGLRVGYALSSPSTIANLRAAGNPYSLSAPSIALAEEVLRNWPADASGYVAAARAERSQLEELATRLGLAPTPSQANFICCETEQAAWLHAALGALGIAIRHFAHRPGLEKFLRITCPGRSDELKRLTDGLETCLQPEVILFDMDGVLADVSASYHEAIRGAAATWGVAVDGPDIRAAKTEPGANNDWEVTRRLVSRAGIEISLEQGKERFEELYQGTGKQAGLWRTETLIPSLDTLAALARRLPLGIVTGRPRADAQRFLQMTGTAGYFQVLVCMEDAPLKPDPAPVLLALQKLGLSRAWMVGDTPDDLVAARRAGVLPLGFLSGARAEDRSRLQAAGAALVLSNFDELMERLP